jgi:hypothetical protein
VDKPAPISVLVALDNHHAVASLLAEMVDILGCQKHLMELAAAYRERSESQFVLAVDQVLFIRLVSMLPRYGVRLQFSPPEQHPNLAGLVYEVIELDY